MKQIVMWFLCVFFPKGRATEDISEGDIVVIDKKGRISKCELT